MTKNEQRLFMAAAKLIKNLMNRDGITNPDGITCPDIKRVVEALRAYSENEATPLRGIGFHTNTDFFRGK